MAKLNWSATKRPPPSPATTALPRLFALVIRAFIREPEFVGQTKPGWPRWTRRMVENVVLTCEQTCANHFGQLLQRITNLAGAILIFLCCAPKKRLAPSFRKRKRPQTATKKLRLPGQADRLVRKTREGTELSSWRATLLAGSGKAARQPRNQALLPLKGKDSETLLGASGKLDTNAEN